MMNRCYFEASAPVLIATNTTYIFGTLSERLPYPVEPSQRAAWLHEIEHLKASLLRFPEAHVFFEFSIPRMGRRADVVILLKGAIFVLEYKLGQDSFIRGDIDQTVGYALDLSNFHETSHDRVVIPILIATNAASTPNLPTATHDNVLPVVLSNGRDLDRILQSYSLRHVGPTLDPTNWMAGRFKPTPTIVEAAQALYRGHLVDEISRSEAGKDNLSKTSVYIDSVIDESRRGGLKSICFVTGVPGSGKTLAGLNIANARMKPDGEGHAVFLSGNGPLVAVLRAALTEDRIAQQRKHPSLEQKPRAQIECETHAFIQPVHGFRDENVGSQKPPVDRIVVFDEAQRAWDSIQAGKFMRKRGHSDFSMSEPEFLLSVMDRHEGWVTIICLIGGGQEINTGEAGIAEWLRALNKNYSHWNVHLSPEISGSEYIGREVAANVIRQERVHQSADLHLNVSLRSFRAESVSNFVGALLANDLTGAEKLRSSLVEYPIYLTRDLHTARRWLRQQRRGQERIGLLASSNALRLKPEGVFMKASIDPCKWFLAPVGDIRSSNALEDAGSEFDVQGLELDWTCVCWDANLRRQEDNWVPYAFRGTRWQHVKQEPDKKFLLNSYRVLLTRARQGMVIFVPRGDASDPTRPPEMYDPVYEFLCRAGMQKLPILQPTKTAIEGPEELHRELVE